jgi:hypothetical protein
MSHTKALRRIHTERRTPIPMKITFAGENTYQIDMRGWILDKFILKHTEPTTFPSDFEKA